MGVRWWWGRGGGAGGAGGGGVGRGWGGWGCVGGGVGAGGAGGEWCLLGAGVGAGQAAASLHPDGGVVVPGTLRTLQGPAARRQGGGAEQAPRTTAKHRLSRQGTEDKPSGQDRTGKYTHYLYQSTDNSGLLQLKNPSVYQELTELSAGESATRGAVSRLAIPWGMLESFCWRGGGGGGGGRTHSAGDRQSRPCCWRPDEKVCILFL